MKCGPLFKWFGSKWQSAKRYPEPRFDIIIEPYAGGAGYSLNYCDRQVRIYDNDPHLCRLWPWLINEATPAAIAEIPLGLPVGTDIRTIGLSEGQALLLKHWQRTNNVGDCWTVSPWGHMPGQWTASTRARLQEDVLKVKHWQWGLKGRGRATIFIDPPYLYNYRYRKGRQFDFEKLAFRVRRLQSLGCQVIACEAVCPKTGAVPDYLPFVPSHESVTSRRKADQSHHSRELIYVG